MYIEADDGAVLFGALAISLTLDTTHTVAVESRLLRRAARSPTIRWGHVP